MVKRLFLLLSVAALTVLTAPAARQATPQGLEPEEHAVYSALIDTILGRVSANVITLDPGTMAEGGEALRLADPSVRVEMPDALRDYIAKNTKSYPLGVTRAFVDLTGRLARGEKTVPCPCLRVAFSRVGFDDRRTRALVRVRYRQSGVPKEQYVVLKRDAGKWNVERRVARFVR